MITHSSPPSNPPHLLQHNSPSSLFSPHSSPRPTRPPTPDPSLNPSLASSPPLLPSSPPSPPQLDSNATFPITLPGAMEGVPQQTPEIIQDTYFDDEGLSAVEKIYLFSRSRTTMHRVFISRSLHTFLPEVTPLEAVEYVLPLLNALAMDDEDAVKEALVSNLITIMWWFFENCQLVEEEPPQPHEEHHDPPLLPVQTFTPFLNSLLIDHNNMVGGPARFTVVEILNRLRAADDRGEDRPPFGIRERRLLEQEIVYQVIIGMGRLDAPEDAYPVPTSHSVSVSPPSPISSIPSSTEAHSQIPALPSSGSPSDNPQSSTSLSADRPHLLPFSPPVPALSRENLSLSPDSPPLPVSPPSQEQQQSLVSLVSSSPPNPEQGFLDWVPQSSQQTSEVVFRTSTTDKTDERSDTEQEDWPTPDEQTADAPLDDASEQAAVGRLSSMSLIATVTANAQLPEETMRAFADEVSYIGGDPLYWVRREASFAVGALAKVVPREVVMLTLLPLFDALTRDTVWHVRHSAVFALPGILARLAPQHRRTLALDTLLSLANDAVPTVRSGVLEVLGEVIYTFHEDDEGAPEELVGLFVGREKHPAQRHRDRTEHWKNHPVSAKTKKPPGPPLSVFDDDDDDDDSRGGGTSPVGMFSRPPPAQSASSGFFGDPARGLITSFNYPAVALTLGPRRWGSVREYYLALTRDGNVRVRRTIAAGLGEMARILGAELAQRDLVDVWDEMVHDAEDGETRLKALGGAAMFVGALEGTAREGVVQGLVELWERWLTGWRERECLTRALPRLAELVKGQGEVVRTLVGKALVDNVAAVREAAIEAISPVLRAFEDRPHFAEALRDDLQGLSCADPCRRRATYIACYQSLIESQHGEAEVANDDLWERICCLSTDQVVDVRIGVARLLGIICDKFYPEPASRPARLSEAIRRLSQDPSRDVQAYVAFLLVPADRVKTQEPLIGPEPPGMFATFSRPPPKTPVLGAVVEEMQDLNVRDEFEMDLALPEDMMPGGWPSRIGVEEGLHGPTPGSVPASPPSRNEREPGEVTISNDLVRRLGTSRRRSSNDWEPS